MKKRAMSGNSSGDKTAIRNVMAAHEAALNAADAQAVMPLYAEDGVFMTPNNQSAVSKAAVRPAHNAVFKAITPRGFVRSNSAGTHKVNASGALSAEGNQELLIFRRVEDANWRLARYSFSTHQSGVSERLRQCNQRLLCKSTPPDQIGPDGRYGLVSSLPRRRIMGEALRLCAEKVRSLIITDSGYFVPEEQPEILASALTTFLKAESLR